MSIDTETVRKVARLARLALREDELAPLAAELNGILGWVEQLGEVDVAGVEPMTSVTPMALKRRADEVTDGNRQAASSGPIALWSTLGRERSLARGIQLVSR
jgi:aspartyl-tRNA(Asn)/glutamyl-tRNA(Gln) amidotransferase subunit C